MQSCPSSTWHSPCSHGMSTCPCGQSHHHPPLSTPPGIQIVGHGTLPSSPLETACVSSFIGVELGWHVTCFGHWNVGRRNNVSLLGLGLMFYVFPLIPFVRRPLPREGHVPWEACWSPHNEILSEKTWTQPTAWSHAQQNSASISQTQASPQTRGQEIRTHCCPPQSFKMVLLNSIIGAILYAYLVQTWRFKLIESS